MVKEDQNIDRDQTYSIPNDIVVDKEKSQGVARIEAVSSSLTPVNFCILLFGIFLVSYAYGLDSQTRNVYQTHATNSFENHSLLSTLNLVKSVGAAAIQPPLSKAANVFGRFEIISFAILLYVVGTLIETFSTNIETYAGGQVLWIMGLRGFQLLFEILLADISSLRNRVIFSYITGVPVLINIWISGSVTSAILTGSTWKWGIGVWAIIIPAVTLPIYFSLFMANRQAKKQGKLEKVHSVFTGKSHWENMIILFWQFDLVGVILIAAILCLLLLPLTIAGGTSSRWAHADVISMLVIGFLCIPAFVIWEMKFAKYPCLPFHLLNNRVVLTCFFIGIISNACWMLQGEYLYTLLVVSFDESVQSATRIMAIYGFTSMVSGIVAGIGVRYTRRIKWSSILGSLLFLLGMGLMIKFRTSLDNGHIGVIAAQVVLGLGAGFIPYPVQAHIQTETKHENVAIITAVYLTMRHVGSSVGNAIAGAIWTNTLPQKLVENYASFNNATNLVKDSYKAPLTFIKLYPMGTPERMALINAYESTQKILTITGCCMTIPLVIAAFTLSNPILGDTQSLPNAEENANKLKTEQDESKTKN
ncbi:MFS transporter [Cunninghamella echinulata]|nr:MFS transporter [Cunninghamella echinulata]